MSSAARILLVEDNRLDVELTLAAFREARLSNPIHVVNDGQDALDYLFGEGDYQDRAAHPLPSLILLDLKLRRVDGREVLRKIKSTPGLRRLPIVVLTSSQREADVIQSYELGTNGYLVKPISFSGFLEVIRGLEHYWLTLNVDPPTA